jgi:hypothetical protein
MSRNINVNPDHYKVAGRERQGENVIHEVERREARRAGQSTRKAERRAMAPKDAAVRASDRSTPSARK